MQQTANLHQFVAAGFDPKSIAPDRSSSVAKRRWPFDHVARRLESLLEDDYICWYDVPVGASHQHPDFLVLHPRRGLLVVEVKDWKLGNLRAIDNTHNESRDIIVTVGVKAGHLGSFAAE